jgi:hypothetical protein
VPIAPKVGEVGVGDGSGILKGIGLPVPIAPKG